MSLAPDPVRSCPWGEDESHPCSIPHTGQSPEEKREREREGENELFRISEVDI